MPSKKDDTFIDALLKHTSLFESSTAFWRWSGYAAISSVLRDSVYWKVGDDRTYPNIYVLLLAISGAHRKGKPIRTALGLVEKLGGIKVISGRTSVQAILDEMRINETDPTTGKMTKGGSATLFAEELAAGIVADDQGVGILTDIYDYKLNFKINLISRGRMKIENMVFSLLAGSNEDLLKGVYTASAINGGLLARTFLITPDEFRPSNSLRSVGDTSKSYNNLLEKLREISLLRGEIQFTEQAWNMYDGWYIPFRESQKGKIDRTGVLGRIHTGVVKIAMILAANDLTIEVNEKHMEDAIDLCIKLLPNYNTFMFSSGKSDIAQAGSLLISDLSSAPNYTMSRKEIIRRNWMNFDAEVLDKLIVALESAELLVQNMDRARGVSYALTVKMLNTLKGKE
jgi:hypothetical protein